MPSSSETMVATITGPYCVFQSWGDPAQKHIVPTREICPGEYTCDTPDIPSGRYCVVWYDAEHRVCGTTAEKCIFNETA